MGKISNEELLKKIGDKFADQFTVVGEPFGLLTLETTREHYCYFKFFKNRRYASVYIS